MNIREEEYILALDKYRSITQAAEYLHVTQPAISIFLSKLEKRLGMTLFERIGKKLVPTQAGQVYLKYAHQVIALNSDFELESAALKKEQRGELHIGCLQKRSYFLMPKLFRRFKETHPGIDVILYNDHPEELFQTLLDGHVDLIYTNQDLHLSELNAQFVRNDHLLLVVPEGHPAIAHAKPIDDEPFPYLSLSHVEHETFYVLRKGYSVRLLIDDAIRYSHIHPQTLRPLDTIELGCQMAAEGLGVSFTNHSYIRNLEDSSPCRYFLTGDLSHKIEWKIFWRKSTVLPQYMMDFMEMLKEIEQETISFQSLTTLAVTGRRRS